MCALDALYILKLLCGYAWVYVVLILGEILYRKAFVFNYKHTVSHSGDSHTNMHMYTM